MARFRYRFSATLVLCLGAALCPQPTLANPITDFTVILLADLASHAITGPDGAAPPVVTVNETEVHLDMSIIAGKVECGSFSDLTCSAFTVPFAFNFWRGNLVFTPNDSDNFFGSDTLTAAGQVFHQAGVQRPHPTDQLMGDIFTFSDLLDGSSATASGPISGTPVPVTFKNHNGPPTQFDRYEVHLDGQAITHLTGNEISAWTFTMTGDHVTSQVPEPASFSLVGLGILLVCWIGYQHQFPDGTAVRSQNRIGRSAPLSGQLTTGAEGFATADRLPG